MSDPKLCAQSKRTCMRMVFDTGFSGRKCGRPANYLASCNDGHDQIVCGRHATWYRRRPAWTVWSLPLVPGVLPEGQEQP